MEKEVTKKVESNIEVLKFLSQFLTIPQIAKQLKVSRTAVYKRINKLLELQLIQKIGKGYNLTEKGLQILNGSSSNQIRLHNLCFKITIFNKPNNWELKRSQIVQMRSFSKSVPLQNTSYEIHSFSNLKVKTTPNSILFYMPTFYGKDTDDCFRQALDSLWNAISKVENLFKVTLVKDRKCNIEIISQHYAKLQDSLAKIYKNEDSKLYVQDEQGNIWLIADYSFRVNELETIYNKTAKEDMDTVKDFLNDLRKNPATISQVVNMIGNVTANQLIFAENMKSHIEAIKSLSRETKRLGKTMKGILEENKNLKLLNKHQKRLFDYS